MTKVILLTGIACGLLVGCTEKKDAGDKVRDAIENAGEKTGEAADKVIDKTEDAAKKVKEKVTQ